MNDPLCLPRTVEEWDELQKLVFAYCLECYGGTQEGSVCVVESARNSGTGVFHFSFLGLVDGVQRMNKGKGFISAAWDKEGRTYCKAQIMGFNPVNIRTTEYNYSKPKSIEKERNAHHRRNSKK